MKKTFTFLGILLFTFPFLTFSAAPAGKLDERVVMVCAMLVKYHYSPKPINDSLSSEVYANFLEAIDPDHLFFTQPDIEKFSAYRYLIDDEIKSGNIIFLHKVTAVLRERIKCTDSIASNILSNPFIYTVQESYIPEAHDYAKDRHDLETRIKKYLKLQMLYKLYTVYETDSLNEPAKFAKKEALLRGKVMASEHRKKNKVLYNPEGYPEYICSYFCNAITAYFDPHSEYFPANEKENFEAEISTESNSFGIQIAENDKGELYITQVIPGSAAWKSGQFHDGDIISSLKWAKEAIDLDGASADEVVNILSSITDQKVDFTFKNASGQQSTVTLKKEKLESNDNIVKSFILKGDKSIGYITLPSFYDDWSSRNGSNCGNDVGKELLKLSKEKIDGLILDLRFNGGGALEEAVELAGIFIDEGTLGLASAKGKKTISLKDPNRGTLFSGPMIVMVNNLTASASELVAGGLQDYNRAIIVGSRTYGKATAQAVFPVDTAISELSGPNDESFKNPPLGYIKITIGKLYRCTGKTNQCIGTTPDIALPDIYADLKISESENKNCIKPDVIKKASYFNPYNPLPLNILSEKSKSRTSSNTFFKSIPMAADIIGKIDNNKRQSVSLNITDFLKQQKDISSNWKKAANAGKDSAQILYKVATLSEDAGLLQADEIKNQAYKTLLGNVSSDIYVKESYLILNDYINYLK